MSDGGKSEGAITKADRQWSLAPWDAFEAVVKVLSFGAKKYPARNWELGMPWSWHFDAAMRHLQAWARGERIDPEDSLPHLWKAATRLLFLISSDLRRIGVDDMPRQTKGWQPGDGAMFFTSPVVLVKKMPDSFWEVRTDNGTNCFATENQLRHIGEAVSVELVCSPP